MITAQTDTLKRVPANALGLLLPLAAVTALLHQPVLPILAGGALGILSFMALAPTLDPILGGNNRKKAFFRALLLQLAKFIFLTVAAAAIVSSGRTPAIELLIGLTVVPVSVVFVTLRMEHPVSTTKGATA